MVIFGYATELISQIKKNLTFQFANQSQLEIEQPYYFLEVDKIKIR